MITGRAVVTRADTIKEIGVEVDTAVVAEAVEVVEEVVVEVAVDRAADAVTVAVVVDRVAAGDMVEVGIGIKKWVGSE